MGTLCMPLSTDCISASTKWKVWFKVTRLPNGAKEENAKQKSWRPKNVTRVRSFSKGWGRKKRWGKEKLEKKSVTDKIKVKNDHRFLDFFATVQNIKLLPPSATNHNVLRYLPSFPLLSSRIPPSLPPSLPPYPPSNYAVLGNAAIAAAAAAGLGKVIPGGGGVPSGGAHVPYCLRAYSCP
jgi:hypothetical protein